MSMRNWRRIVVLAVALFAAWNQYKGRGGAEDRPRGNAPKAERELAERPISKGSSDRASENARVLRSTGHGRLSSPAGLLYMRGTEDGTHLKHVLRHAVDDPGRRGKHGVFEGGENSIVELIDEVYKRYQRGEGRSRRDGAKTIIDVDLGRVVGYVGGEWGKKRGRPAARSVRLVLVGQKVITAYPTK